jgi:hypothetical protein
MMEKETIHSGWYKEVATFSYKYSYIHHFTMCLQSWVTIFFMYWKRILCTSDGTVDFLIFPSMVRRGLVGSASAPSLILGSAPQGGVSPLSRQAMKKWREFLANVDG